MLFYKNEKENLWLFQEALTVQKLLQLIPALKIYRAQGFLEIIADLMKAQALLRQLHLLLDNQEFNQLNWKEISIIFRIQNKNSSNIYKKCLLKKLTNFNYNRKNTKYKNNRLFNQCPD